MHETLYVGCVISVLRHRQLFTHAAFQLVVYRVAASSECIFQGTKKMELGEGGGGVLNWTVGKMRS